MVTMASNTKYKGWLSSTDDTIISLEKAQSGKTTLDDISEGLDEYKRLHIAGLASPAELVTLHRAFPDNVEYEGACEGIKNDEGEFSFMVVGGPASVEVVDREGHLITTDALKKAFKRYMKNFRGRNVMVMHSDVQVGHALPVYISKAGNVFKSGVDKKGLFFIAELRDDTKISNRVREQIEKGGMKSYSIAGSATKSREINKSDGSHVLQVDDMELAEVTICEKGVNQNAHFELLKGDKAEGSCVDGSCLTKSHDTVPEPQIIAISKSEMPSFKDMFTSWITKADKDEKDEDTSRAVAIATAQAKKEGYKKFTDGSPGDDRRDKIAEEIKESIKKAFLRKQGPQDYGAATPGYQEDANKRFKETPRTGAKFLGSDRDAVRYVDELRTSGSTPSSYFIDYGEGGQSTAGPQESDVDKFRTTRLNYGDLGGGDAYTRMSDEAGIDDYQNPSKFMDTRYTDKRAISPSAKGTRVLSNRNYTDRQKPIDPRINLSEKSISKQLFLNKLQELV